ncbi:hypothetical protein M9Y10_017525 [Tritrichomonas musculus]|uniref:Leucine Rich Repeat family protein n=1 Tax=Tritrichomonas musculus TaxID=1915356 RepID=A0ABR2HTT4_9EUKA
MKNGNLVATNLEEIKNLLNYGKELYGKIITIQGILIKKEHKKPIKDIIYHGKPKLICFDNCIIGEFSHSVFRDFGCSLSVNNCQLTPETGEMILRALDPYSPVDVDLSNNNLGDQGCEELLNYIKDVISSGIQGFRRLNLTNNNFSEERIKDMNNFICTEHASFITIQQKKILSKSFNLISS